LNILGLVVDDKSSYGQRSVLYKVERKQPKPKYGTQEYFKALNQKVSCKFQILVLTHIFYMDDFHISLNETYELKKHFKDYKHVMDKEDIKEIKSYMKKKITLAKLVDFYRVNRLDSFDVQKSLRLAAIITRNDPKYVDVIEAIQKRFISEPDN